MEPTKKPNLPALNLEALIIDAAEVARASVASNTKRAYLADWQCYAGFCDTRGYDPSPPREAILLAYFQDLQARRKLGTVLRRRFGLQRAFEEMGFPNPFADRKFRDYFKGLKRTKAGEGIDQPLPVTRDILSRLVGALEMYEDDLARARNKAIVTLGLAAGGRRISELAALTVRDLTFDDRGLKVRIGKSKTDQEGKGHVVGVLYSKHERLCAVRSVTDWLEASGIREGRVFRRLYRGGNIGESLTTRAISGIVKDLAGLAGLPYRHFSGHSLRHGFIAQASIDGEPVQKVMNSSLHTSVRTVVGYMKQANPYDAGAQVL